jgi:ribose transport system permease protein
MTFGQTQLGGSSAALARQRRRRSLVARLMRWIAFDRIGAIYVWVAIIIVFSFWAPATFPHVATAKQVLNSNAITGLGALAIVIPLCARVFDLSFAYVMTLTGVSATYFIHHGVSLVPSLLLALLIGLGVGVGNAFVVVVMKIDSFIGTLATGLLISALVTIITNGTNITDERFFGGFSNIAQTAIWGVTLPVVYCFVVALAIWYLLEHTATGRRLYATGFNPDASRLAGVRTERLRFGALMASGLLAGATGIVLASTISAGTPGAGTPYLLPGFAAAFLGATQLKHGRFNAWGTMIAVLMLGTGITGLGLAAAPPWSADMFVGVVLISALAATSLQRRKTVGATGGRDGTPERASADGPAAPAPSAGGFPTASPTTAAPSAQRVPKGG